MKCYSSRRSVERAKFRSGKGTVAALAAVSAWAELANKYGAGYAMWHNASGAKIKCEKFPRSDYYMCFAGGKPCRALYAGVTGSHGRGD